uniref:Queuosine 5'-phosphate N-glycosylase/hydrolase n=1 Tax=Spongospora subterranea TaxID=70186 RepID=A0A0H5R8P7_9EUKA|eukprot:CRZ10092.1 hypothetical protein [Spongospora subterranea]
MPDIDTVSHSSQTNVARGQVTSNAFAAVLNNAVAIVMKAGQSAGLNVANIDQLVDLIPDNVPFTPGTRYPLRFESISEEINFTSLVHLVAFGAFFNNHIAASHHNVMTMFEVAERGMLGLFISGKLNASRLVDISLVDVESAFGLPLSCEEQMENIPAYISVDAPTKPLVEDIVKCLNDTGRILLNRRCPSLGDLILNEMDKKLLASPASAGAMMQLLAATFPAFNDLGFFSKATALTAALYWTFKDRVPSLDFSDASDIGCPSDFDLIDFFFDMGVIEVKETSDTISAELLRALAVVGGRQIRSRILSKRGLDYSMVDLDMIFREIQASRKKTASAEDRPDRPYHAPRSFFF